MVNKKYLKKIATELKQKKASLNKYMGFPTHLFKVYKETVDIVTSPVYFKLLLICVTMRKISKALYLFKKKEDLTTFRGVGFILTMKPYLQ